MGARTPSARTTAQTLELADIRKKLEAIKDAKGEVVVFKDSEPILKVGETGNMTLPATILQIIDDYNMIVHWKDLSLWIIGFPTDGHVDGEKIALGYVHIAGTKRYGTALGGAKTVFVLGPEPEENRQARLFTRRTRSVS